MNNIYTTTVLALCAIIIIKLLIENKKLKSKLFNNDNQLLVVKDKKDPESVNPLTSVENISIDEKESTPATPSKNAFLHWDDNFGRMEKGVVIDSVTYIYENKKEDSFEI
jgi:hypothetical protein